MTTTRSASPPPLNMAKRKKLAVKAPKGILGYVVFLVFAGIPAIVWFGCRIEPQAGEIAVLTRKTGADLPSGQILALHEDEKGIQLDVLPEGRYFRNPYTWNWEIRKITDIPAGRLGVKTRLYGGDLPPGDIISDGESKGVLPDVLRPGRYRINPYAFHVEMFDAITIRPGHVGVMTRLVGEDVLQGVAGETHTNTFLVSGTEKGVVSDVLDPGTYFLNPYMVTVSEVNLQGQRFEMSGKDAISFLTLDGFTVTVEGTIEFALSRDNAALLTHRVGDMDDIIKKVILPRARGFSRIEGSKHPAIDFIVGENRQRFQNDLDADLRSRCESWGVEIRSVLIRKIEPPDEIASINRDREVAVQESRKFEQEITQAKSKAELVKQEMLAVQNREKVEADTKRIRAVINAEQSQAVQVIDAQRELDVAKVEYDAAAFQAQAVVLRAEGQRDAVDVRNVAEASVLQDQVDAFGSGMALARYSLYKRVAPQIQAVISGDGPEGLGGIFELFAPGRKGVSQ